MSVSEIEVGNKNSADYVKLTLAIVLFLGGFTFYYMTAGKQDNWLRNLVIILSIIASAGVFLTSSTGKSLILFFRAAYAELLRVVWPTGRETTQMTIVVFGFVIIMSILLWIIDKSLEYALFDLLLGWRK
jgi:preprotein translocase subunit SecE